MTAAPRYVPHLTRRFEADEVKHHSGNRQHIVQKWYTDTISSGLEFLMLGLSEMPGRQRLMKRQSREPRPTDAGLWLLGHRGSK